jgi:hypothetical protein
MTMKRPTSSKSAPSGPSAATAAGGGSIRDRNTRGPAARDSSRRAEATGGEESDEGGGVGAAQAPEAGNPAADQSSTGGYDPHAKQSKAEEYTVLEGGTIDDGKGGKFKVCKPGDTVTLSPERADHFRSHGVPLESKDEKQEREKREKRERAEATG